MNVLSDVSADFGRMRRAATVLTRISLRVWPADNPRRRRGIRMGAAVVDRGIVIPNVTDAFSGRAPDLGALEINADHQNRNQFRT